MVEYDYETYANVGVEQDILQNFIQIDDMQCFDSEVNTQNSNAER